MLSHSLSSQCISILHTTKAFYKRPTQLQRNNHLNQHRKQETKRRRKKSQEMVDQLQFLLSLISLLLTFFPVLWKAIHMALCSSPSSHVSHPPPLSWKRLAEQPARPSLDRKTRAVAPKDVTLEMEVSPIESGEIDSNVTKIEPAMPAPRKIRKRPGKIAIPETCVAIHFMEAGEVKDDAEDKELEVEGSGYSLVSKRGSRHAMEDGYGVITDINGDSKQAFFGVFDGHGGRAAVDFVREKLGKNIVAAVSEEGDDQLGFAIRAGYLTTDREFSSQGVSSGVCAATALLKNGELLVSNVGDCRVVLSKKRVATALTRDHSAGNEDERNRIQSLGGYVTCHNGVWRVHDSLAISRAIGDANMKEWVISEPETKMIQLTPDCDFLMISFDGLWNKVSNQEAVDVVSRHENSLTSCRDLVEMSFRRGNRDDITVMVVDLQKFIQSKD